jgi:cob(I)alamin adenosyltransferase
MESEAKDFMDEEEIHEKLLDISAIHSTFDEDNAITFMILLSECKDKMNDEQIKWCEKKIESLKKKKNSINNKWLKAIDNEITRMPLSEKIDNSPFSPRQEDMRQTYN